MTRLTRADVRRELTFSPPARDPLRIALAASTAMQGVGLLLGGPGPGSTEVALTPFLVYVWAAGLAAAGLALLLSAVWRGIVTSVLIEAIGCGVGFLAIAAFAVGAIDVLGRGALVLPVLNTIGYGIGCAFRVGFIIRDVRRLERRQDAGRYSRGPQ